MTISRDLEGLNTCLNPARPKGGRPKGSGNRKSKPRQTDKQEEKIIALNCAGLTSPEIAAEVGVEGRAVRHVLERERIKGEAEAQIDPSTLSMTAKEKFDAAIKQHKRKLRRRHAITVPVT